MSYDYYFSDGPPIACIKYTQLKGLIFKPLQPALWPPHTAVSELRCRSLGGALEGSVTGSPGKFSVLGTQSRTLIKISNCWNFVEYVSQFRKNKIYNSTLMEKKPPKTSTKQHLQKVY